MNRLKFSICFVYCMLMKIISPSHNLGLFVKIKLNHQHSQSDSVIWDYFYLKQHTLRYWSFFELLTQRPHLLYTVAVALGGSNLQIREFAHLWLEPVTNTCLFSVNSLYEKDLSFFLSKGIQYISKCNTYKNVILLKGKKIRMKPDQKSVHVIISMQLHSGHTVKRSIILLFSNHSSLSI